jgi:hypothetical protein
MNPFLYSYKEAFSMVEEFELLMSTKGMKISKDSQLERICNNVKKLSDPNFNFEPFEDIRPFYREVLGLNDLIIKLLSIKHHIRFDVLIKHLSLLNEDTTIPQTMKHVITNQNNSNKIFELVMASCCMKLSNEVEVDDPKESKGDNPDVLLKFDDHLWGIACKVMNTTEIKVESILKNVIIGIDQIEKSDASKGIVIVNLKNNLYYDELWPITNLEEYKNRIEEPSYGSFLKEQTPFDMLIDYGLVISSEISKIYNYQILYDIFKNKKAFPCILLFLQTATSLSKNGKPYPMTCGIFHLLNLLNLRSQDYEVEFRFLKALNISMHN